MSEKLPEFIGPYRIQSKLGQGGMGAVYRAAHETLDRPAAVKLLPPDMAGNPEYVSRFLREARTVATLNHAHIVQVYDAGAFEGKYFIAMELIEGQSLLDYCEEKGKLDEQEAVRLLHQAALGLSIAHAKGLTHRDIKPENLLLDQERDLHIVDFGLVRETASQTQLTVTGACLGTPMYMSPEQADGEQADARSDIYSLGITFYRAVAGQPPFFSPTVMSLLFKHKFDAPADPRKFQAELSEDLVQLLFAMMAKSPKDRPQDGQALVELVEKLKRGESMPKAPAFSQTLEAAGRPSPEGGTTREEAGGAVATQRSKILLLAGAGALAVLLLAVGAVVLFAFLAGGGSGAGDEKGGGTTDGGGQGVTATSSGSEGKDGSEPSGRKKDDEWKQLVEGARKFEDTGELELALAMYERALAGHEENAALTEKVKALKWMLDEFRRYIRDGDRALATGEFAAARANYTRALRLRPTSAEAKGKLEEVDGQRVSPKEVAAHVDRLVREGKDGEAAAVLTKALRAQPLAPVLTETREALNALQAFGDLHGALVPLLLKGRDAAQEVRSLSDGDDGIARDLRRSLEAMATKCDSYKVEVRTHFLARARLRMLQILADAKGMAASAGVSLQSAFERYEKKAREAESGKGFGVGPFRVRAKVDKEKAGKYDQASQTFAVLAGQARTLSQ